MIITASEQCQLRRMNAQCWDEPEEQSVKAIEEMMRRGLYSLRKLKARRDQLARSATHPNHICLSLCVCCDCVCVCVCTSGMCYGCYVIAKTASQTIPGPG